ncbi:MULTISPECIES: nuclear transport factor 2 family protein [unclassified Roseivivax]|uniref:nuclear transport factor 2 family protein n=1 Tax=Roseivivax sp. GX 12232 TaxID=2900547 RepID=UPI001E48A881|nr:nuclear transport factor 2 family protein [Roseivivax sp. GX 12232]MCE0504077.1 nuclear transport factor 2 family protein [Roseivivax sp. GX 12232]
MNSRILLSVLAASLTSAPALAETFPPQHWASAGGLVSLEPHGAADLSALEAGDLRQIEEAFIRWGLYYDEGRSDLLSSLFAEEGSLVATLGSAEPIASFTGPEAIAEYVDATLGQQGDQRRHSITNFIVEEASEDSAHALAYGIVLVAADGLSVGSSVLYDGELEKNGQGVWTFSKLTIAIDDYAGNLN